MKLTPLLLGRLTWPWFKSAPHIESFEEKFLEMYNSPTINRLIVSVPVRHCKTTYFGTLVPAWALLMNPLERIIIASHSLTFSAEQVSKARDLIAEYGGILTGTYLDENCSRAQHFRIRGEMGECRAVGVSSSCAGMTSSLSILDDPYADEETALSATQRTKLEQWFSSELLTRGTPCANHPPKTIIIASRRHSEDITAYLLGLNKDLSDENKWHHIEYKAINDKGEALWPDMFPIEKLKQTQYDLELKGLSYQWDGLYQQDPTTNPQLIEFPKHYFTGEDLFYDILPPIDAQCSTGGIDLALGKSEHGDYSCAVKIIHCKNGHKYVDDSLLLRTPLGQFEQDCAEFFDRNDCDSILVETNFDPEFSNRLNNVAWINCHNRFYLNEVHHTNQKEVRIRKYLSSLLREHKIHFRNTPANRLIVKQIEQLFSAKNDDGPDCVCIALEMYSALTRKN